MTKENERFMERVRRISAAAAEALAGNLGSVEVSKAEMDQLKKQDVVWHTPAGDLVVWAVMLGGGHCWPNAVRVMVRQ